MVQIVQLAPGKCPPSAERFILIEHCSPGGRTTLTRSGNGILVKVPAPFLRTEIEAFRRMAEEGGMAKVYLRGVPEALRAPNALSPWAA